MSNTEGDAAKKNRHRAYNLTLAAVTSQVGCITVVFTVGALFAGRWLDSRLDTTYLWTLVLMGLSLPVSLVTMFWIVRWTTSKMLIPKPEEEKTPSEEEDIG